MHTHEFFKKYWLSDTKLAPFHAFIQINTPNDVRNLFFVNLTCSESKFKDDDNNYYLKTTWSLEGSMEVMVANVIINRNEAMIGSGNGSDSKYFFYKNWLY